MAHDAEHDPAQLLMAVLVDELADRLVSRLAPEIAVIVGAAETKAAASASDDAGLWTARRVAERYGVAVRFIYQHAEQLGCIRLGGSARPRLRFDPAVVRDRWQLVGGGLPDVATPRRRPAARQPPRRRKADASSELLEFDRGS